MFAKIKHLAIISDNYALLSRFYEALFGMKIIEVTAARECRGDRRWLHRHEHHSAKAGSPSRPRALWPRSRRRRKSKRALARKISVGAVDQKTDQSPLRRHQHPRPRRLRLRSFPAGHDEPGGSLRRGGVEVRTVTSATSSCARSIRPIWQSSTVKFTSSKSAKNPPMIRVIISPTDESP